MLRDIGLLNVYDSSEYDLIGDLMVPCISSSISYIRGVGFFSSGWLKLAAKGIKQLIINGGTAQFIMSPILEESDWEAMKLGVIAKESPEILSILSRNLDQLQQSLEEDTRNTLAWLIADDLLSFHFAIPRNRDFQSDYHDKVGLCTDEDGDRVAFHGSFNDSIKGTMNGEAFSVFRSWNEGQAAYVEQHEKRLNQLFQNGNSQFEVFGIPETIKNEFIRLRTTDHRPYKRKFDISVTDNSDIEQNNISVPFELHDYQKIAIQKWMDNDCLGLFDMATGTGKTITSLAAAVEIYGERKKIALVILVPYLHLVEQWTTEVKKFGFSPISCSGENSKWRSILYDKVTEYNIGIRDNLCVIATHQTAASDDFEQGIKRCPNNNLLLLGDEVHALGASNLRRGLFPFATMRLGLSATPERWYDPEGTAVLHKYFKDVVYEFPLEKAIGKFLTPYNYHPIPIHLMPSEMTEFKDLTQKIIVLFSMEKKKRENGKTNFNRLLIKRAKIIAKAEQKYDAVGKIIQKLKEQGTLKHLLVYCAAGDVDRVVEILTKQEGIRCHRFVHDVSLTERKKILNDFGAGHLEALVAIKCLDEGVDVPATRTTIFMASTTNPREFIQRRGRILRKYESKRIAEVYDMVVLPDPHDNDTDIETAKSLIRREMPRFAEFACGVHKNFGGVMEPSSSASIGLNRGRHTRPSSSLPAPAANTPLSVSIFSPPNSCTPPQRHRSLSPAPQINAPNNSAAPGCYTNTSATNELRPAGRHQKDHF